MGEPNPQEGGFERDRRRVRRAELCRRVGTRGTQGARRDVEGRELRNGVKPVGRRGDKPGPDPVLPTHPRAPALFPPCDTGRPLMRPTAAVAALRRHALPLHSRVAGRSSTDAAPLACAIGRASPALTAVPAAPTPPHPSRPVLSPGPSKGPPPPQGRGPSAQGHRGAREAASTGEETGHVSLYGSAVLRPWVGGGRDRMSRRAMEGVGSGPQTREGSVDSLAPDQGLPFTPHLYTKPASRISISIPAQDSERNPERIEEGGPQGSITQSRGDGDGAGDAESRLESNPTPSGHLSARTKGPMVGGPPWRSPKGPSVPLPLGLPFVRGRRWDQVRRSRRVESPLLDVRERFRQERSPTGPGREERRSRTESQRSRYRVLSEGGGPSDTE